jgi:amidase
MVTKGDWRAIAKAKQAERWSKIPKEWIIREELYKGEINVTSIPTICGVLTENEIHITSDYDATALLEKLRVGKFSSEEVTVAFCKRAAIAQQLVKAPASLLGNKNWRNAKFYCRPIA